MNMSLGSLARLVDGNLHGSVHGSVLDADAVVVDSVSLDSHEVSSTGLFAALPGTRVHGASFAADTPAAAILSDAAGLEILTAAGETRPILVVDDVRAVLGTIAAEIYGHPTRDMTVIGITGTSGKTTTTYLVEAGLLAAGKSVGLIGTTGTRINREPLATKLTTPEAPKLQELFAMMRDRGVTHVVMEVSSHALALGRVQGTHFAAAGFSNLSQDHLDFHPTMEDYFAVKAQLFDGSVQAAHAVICVDDDWGEAMASRAAAQGVPTLRVATGWKEAGTGREAGSAGREAAGTGLVAEQIGVDSTGLQHVRLRVHGAQAAEVSYQLPLPGPFNIANSALASGLGLAVGVPLETFVAGMESVAVPGRMERVDRGQDFLAVVDYAHKPAAVSAVLDTLREQLDAAAGMAAAGAAGSDGERRRIGVVIGAGGDRDATKRAIMGANAAQRADLVIVTDDNPRTEDPAAIRAAVRSGADSIPGTEVREVASRAQAIDQLVEWAQPGDAIIVVGKGHEVGQVYGTQTEHFDDREELARALEERGKAR